jgi:hypothetical protein
LTLLFLGLAVAVAGVLGLVLVPKYLLKSAQDRLASATIGRDGEVFRLLTRADLVAGRYRRVPGVLGLKEEELQFSGLFGETVQLPTSNIQKIVTGVRLASGRLLTGPKSGDPAPTVRPTSSCSPRVRAAGEPLLGRQERTATAGATRAIDISDFF